jgi:lipoprotein signal peptidase
VGLRASRSARRGLIILRLYFSTAQNWSHKHGAELESYRKMSGWYVFNLADVEIVAGAAALLYDSFLGGPAAKAP